MHVSIVVACAEDGVIGAAGGIPWRLPDDQQHFKRLTLGHCIVMGRGTYESIGRLLPGRTTIVISRNQGYAVPGAYVVDNLDGALAVARAQGETEIFVVGGEQIYALAMPFATRLHLTRVHARIDGDVRFRDPTAAPDTRWKRVHAVRHEPDERHVHAFSVEVWERSLPDDLEDSPLSRS